MRKVERQMLAAIAAGKNKTIGNTYVTPVIGKIEVFLHGNHIADVEGDTVTPNLQTFANWPTRTTASRLRALGIGAHFVNRAPCIDGTPI